MDRKNGIIFDLDGTLWDSSYQVGIAWNAVFSKYNVGIEVNEQNMRLMMGRTVPEIGEAILGNFDTDRRAQILLECCEAENHLLRQFGGVLYEGVVETLALLSRKYPLFIVSNCQCGYIESFMEYHNTGAYISDTECVGGTGKNKAYNIRLVVERNNLNKAIYVGDTRRDMLAAKQAGIPFIHAAYGFDGGFDSEYRIERLRELPKLAAGLFGEELI